MLQENTAKTIAHWAEVVRKCNMECRAHGMTKEDWLKQHQVKEQDFYYWQTMIRQMEQDMALAEPTTVFAKIAESQPVGIQGVMPEVPSGITVTVGSVTVKTNGNLSNETLEFLRWVVLNA